MRVFGISEGRRRRRRRHTPTNRTYTPLCVRLGGLGEVYRLSEGLSLATAHAPGVEV